MQTCAFLAVVALVLTACQPTPESATPSTEIDGGGGAGPLYAGEAGGIRLKRQGARLPWQATFGNVLCTRGGVPATIERVSYQRSVEPINIEAATRQMDNVRPGKPDPSIIAERGGLENIPGHLTSPRGFVVDRSCSDNMMDAYSELLTEVTAARRGASIDAVIVDYTAEGRSRSLRIDWAMQLCGRAVQARDC